MLRFTSVGIFFAMQVVDHSSVPAGKNGQRDKELLEDALQEEAPENLPPSQATKVESSSHEGYPSQTDQGS